MVSHMDRAQCCTQMGISIVENGLMEERKEGAYRFIRKLIENMRENGDRINQTETGN